MMGGGADSDWGPPSTLVLPKTFIPSLPHPRPLPFLSVFLPTGEQAAGVEAGLRGPMGGRKGGSLV